jgi:hypothetical protein
MGNEFLTESRRVYWDQLRELDQKEVCQRALVSYSGPERGGQDDEGFYTIPVLNGFFRVYPEREDTVGPKRNGYANKLDDEELELLMLQYLLNAKDIPYEGKWVTGRDLKGGSLFFNGPHALPTKVLEDAFGEDEEGFRKACE